MPHHDGGHLLLDLLLHVLVVVEVIADVVGEVQVLAADAANYELLDWTHFSVLNCRMLGFLITC